jgi:O-antigen/teichoic acid export membrane protein
MKVTGRRMRALTMSVGVSGPTGGRGSHNRRGFGWGLVAQVFSSATNFGFALLAGRLLGPGGLGLLFIGFSGYFLVLALQRATVTQPLIVHSATLPAVDRLQLAGSGITVIALTGAAAGCLFGLLGLGVGGHAGRGLLLFAPWLIPSLLQEYWKAILFQEGKALAGATSDVVRFGAMCTAALLVLVRHADYMIAASWGLGACAGLVIALVGLRTLPKPPREALRLWGGKAWALGRWLGVREVLFQTGTYSTVLVLASVLGTADLGGLRAAQALFSPFSLIDAAFVLPGLPAISRALRVSRHTAWQLAVRISGAALLLAAGYLVVMTFAGPWLLTSLFGHSFAPFDSLIWPVAVAQLLGSASLAFPMLLMAERRGIESALAAAVGSAATFGCAALLAVGYGVTGAAWGWTAGTAVIAATFVLIAMRTPTPPVVTRSRAATGISDPR